MGLGGHISVFRVFSSFLSTYIHTTVRSLLNLILISTSPATLEALGKAMKASGWCYCVTADTLLSGVFYRHTSGLLSRFGQRGRGSQIQSEGVPLKIRPILFCRVRKAFLEIIFVYSAHVQYHIFYF